MKRKVLLLVALVLTLTALFSVMMINSSASTSAELDIDGKKYTVSIPDDAVIAVFAKGKNATDYTFVTTGTDVIDSGIDKARSLLLGEQYAGGTVYIKLLKSFDQSRSSGWNRGFQFNGTVIADLGGYTLTSTAPRLIGFEMGSNDMVSEYTSRFEMKNGTYSSSNEVIKVFAGGYANAIEKTCETVFNNVTFNITATGSYNLLNVSGTFKDGQSVNFNSEFNNCVFNTAAPASAMLLNDANAAVTSNLTVTGNIGNIGVSRTTLSLPDSAGLDLGSEYGNFKIDSSYLTYSVKYAVITKSNEGYTVYKTYDGFGNGALANAASLLDPLSGNYVANADEAFICMLVNEDTYEGVGSSNSGGWNNATHISGTLTVDFRGNKLTSTAPRFIGFLNQTNYDTYSSNVIIKNGTLVTSKVISEIWDEGATAYSGTKNCSLTFDNVKLEPNGTIASPFTMINSRGSLSSSKKASLDVKFNNCTFNYNSSTQIVVVADTFGEGILTTKVELSGGWAKSNSFTPISGAESGEDSYVFIKGESGQRTELVFPYTATAPTITYNTDEGEMHLAAKSFNEGPTLTSYYLSAAKTPYGYIPEDLSINTFSIYYNDLHLGSYDSFYDTLAKVNGYLYAANGVYKGDKITVYMSKDYTQEEGTYGNLAQIYGEVTLDLGNHTFTEKDSYMLDVVGKAVNGTIIEKTAVTVKNGTILTNGKPVMRISSPKSNGSANFNYSGTKPYEFSFEGVTFDKTAASAYNPIVSVDTFDDHMTAAGTKLLSFKADFNDCEFNTDSGLIFDLSVSNFVNAQVTVKGGTINSNTLAKSGIMTVSNSSDTLTMAKKDSDSYPILKMPADAATPEATFNGGALEYVRASEESGIATFTLMTAGLNSYLPKTNITLDSSLVMNVFVPAFLTKSFTLDGDTYTDLTELDDKRIALDDGKDYYRFDIPLSAYTAAREISLVSTVEYEEGSARGEFKLSIPKYAASIIGGEDAVEAALLKDVLSYIRAAYSFFNMEDAEAMAKIDELLGDGYDEANPPATAGSETDPTEGLTGVTFALNSTPAIRFYIGENDSSRYTFFIGDKQLKANEGNDPENPTLGKYLEMDVYAYEMCETVTYKIDGIEKGSYNISAYYAWSKGKNNEKLVTLVERFMRYAESAKAYKNSMITVNYVNENGEKLYESKSLRLSGTDTKTLKSPAIAGYYTRDLFLDLSSEDQGEINVIYKVMPTNIDETYVNTILPNITSWGDSITAGAKKEDISSATQYGIDLEALGSDNDGATYSEVLANLISASVFGGINVANCGVGGEPTSSIAARANTENYYLYLGSDVTIGADPVVIDLGQAYPDSINPGRIGVLRKDIKDHMKYVTIIDGEKEIRGILTCKLSADMPSTETNNQLYNAAYQYLEYTFTRQDGKTDPITLSANSRVVMDAAVEFDGRTCIIFMGENNGYSNVGTTDRDPSILIAQQKEILKACGNPKHFLIVSTTSGTNVSRAALTEALTNEWGANYINIGNELNSMRGYEIAGFPEEAIESVADNIAEGSVSKLLVSDTCHPNAVGYAVIGNLLFEKLFEIGAFDAVFDYYDSLNA